jgi:hypothetical protein
LRPTRRYPRPECSPGPQGRDGLERFAKRASRPRQQRFGGLRPKPQPNTDLLNRHVVDVIALERLGVVRRQVIEHPLDQRGHTGAIERGVRVILARSQRLEGSPDFRVGFDQLHVERAAVPLLPRIQLMAAERAQPGQERRFSTKRMQFPNPLADGVLGDVPGRRIRIEPETHEREPIQDRVGDVEEPLERGLISGEHLPHELQIRFRPAVVHHRSNSACLKQIRSQEIRKSRTKTLFDS